MADQQMENGGYHYSRVHPQKFMLWVSMASMSMLFAGFTSALIVSKGNTEYWLDYRMPWVFWLSTLVVIASSFSMHRAVKLFKESSFKAYRMMLGATFVLGITFLLLQLIGWYMMTNDGMPITRNASGDYIYLISGVHGAHLLGGLVVMAIVLFKVVRSMRDPLFEVHTIINPKKKLNLELLAGYWHFVDLLWIYLFIFFNFTYA